MVDGTLTVFGISADGVVRFIWQDGHGCAFEAVVLDRLANRLEVSRATGVEDRDFHTIVSDRFEFGKEVEVAFSNVTCPEK